MTVNLPQKDFERKAAANEQFFAHSPFSIVTMVVRIKGHLTEEMLATAVSKAQQRHALLRARIQINDDHSMTFTTDGAQAIPIQTASRKSDTDWITLYTEAAKQPFEFETRPAIRFILAHSPQLSELIIVCHHIICDGLSLAYLARDLMQYMGDAALAVEALPVPPIIDLDNLPHDISQSGIANWLINRMNQTWAEECETFDQLDYETLTKAYWDHFTHKIISIELDETATTALVERCRDENVTVNSAVTAAFSGAQSFVEAEQPYHKKIVVAANLRDRMPESPGEAMGMYAGGVELNFRYNDKKNFWENARKFHKKIFPKYNNKTLFSDVLNWLYLDPTIFEAMSFKKLGGLVPADSPRYKKLAAFSKKEDIVLKLLQRDHLDTLENKIWGIAMTNLGRLNFPTTYGALELDRMIFQPGGGIPLANANLVIGVVTFAGKLSLIVEYAPEAIAPSTVEAIKAKALGFLGVL
ncbi:MAG TPA: condensation domain-containing protein [Anaerolineales bacterium]|nr:condensation domain-containing protein [Anaerolineales bacterium]